MKKFVASLETFCTKTVFLIATAMFGCLTFWAVKYTHEYQSDLVQEKAFGSYDSLGPNALTFVLLLVVFFILQKLLLRGEKEKQRKRVLCFVIVDMVLVGIWAVIWVAGSHIMPNADQYQVYLTAVDFTKGIFTDMEAYFYMCPQQYGLAFLYECVLWIWESYHLMQYINVIFLLMILFFGYKLSEDLFESTRAGFYTVLVMNLFVPLFLYVNFVYGELCTTAMSLCSAWAVLRWMQKGKKRYVVTAVIAMTLAIMVRMNMVIVAIALAIVLLIFTLRNKNWKACVVAVLLFVVPFSTIEAVELSYELRSGLEVGRGIPTIAVVAMGMQQSWHGAGVYNAYNHQTFWNAGGGDTDKAAEVAWEYVRGRIREFKADLPTTRYFYQSKIWEQWNVGSFGSLFMTNHFESAPFAPTQELYGGELKYRFLEWVNYYVFVIYLGATIYSLYGLISQKELKKTLLPMVVIGGMIFSLLWEAKPRYVFPYIVMILPAVAMGLHLCHCLVETILKKVKEKAKWTK